jgi:hypothetical protein
MSTTHALFHYSVTIHTDDPFLLGCFRSLSQDAQAEINVRIPSGATKKRDWERADHHVTFRFSAAAKRTLFLELARKLFPVNLWRQVYTSDDNSASQQS